MAEDPDERFKIEGDPEDALRSLMGTGSLPEFHVSLSEADGAADYPEGAPAPNAPTPAYRVFEWTGHAPSPEAANEAALDAWAKHYGERPRNARALVKRVKPPTKTN
jgi:hypothetical protein